MAVWIEINGASYGFTECRDIRSLQREAAARKPERLKAQLRVAKIRDVHRY